MIIPREQPLRWRIEAVESRRAEGVMGQTVTLPADTCMPCSLDNKAVSLYA